MTRSPACNMSSRSERLPTSLDNTVVRIELSTGYLPVDSDSLNSGFRAMQFNYIVSRNSVSALPG